MADTKTLALKPDVEAYPEDVSDIVEAFRIEGFEISRQDAAVAWSKHSDEMCAGWLRVDGNIVAKLRKYFDEVP
jgi:hypothetical protein